MATILVTGARAPVALHLARLLSGAGHRVLMADSLPSPMAAASRVHLGFHLLPPPRYEPEAFARALHHLIAEEAVDLVLPSCEEVFHLALLWQRDPPSARLIAPEQGLLAEVHDKYCFILRCQSLGLEVPQTWLLSSREDLRALAPKARDLVLKPVWSRFAAEVLIRPEPRALEAVLPSKTRPWVAQEYLPGEEICAYALAHQGQVTALSLYRGLYRAGKGASVAFARVQDPAAADFVTRFVRGTGWNGQISFDLMRMEGGRVLPLECNPRATSGVHFFRDPPGFSAALLGEAETKPDVSTPQGVRLALWLYGLPAALRRGEMAKFRQALREVQDVLEWPGDPGPKRAQFATLRAMAARAMRQRISLQKASTHDIEWNGPEGR